MSVFVHFAASVEDGSLLPKKYEPFPQHMYGRPLEEIDTFIYEEVRTVSFTLFRNRRRISGVEGAYTTHRHIHPSSHMQDSH